MITNPIADAPRSMIPFKVKSFSTELDFGSHVRFTPHHHNPCQLPPTPPTGHIVIDSTVKTTQAEIVESADTRLVIRVGQRLHVLTNLKPTEMHQTISYVEGSGASDWVVRRS